MRRKLLLTCGYAAAGALVLAAIASSIARMYPSLYQNYLPSIQENISYITGKPVQIEKIRIDWHGYVPMVTVDGLSVYSDDTRQDRLVFAEKTLVSIDLYKSLLDRAIAIRKLHLTGVNLEVMRTGDQRILLNGIDISERIASGDDFDETSEISVSLSESTVAIKDEILNLDYFFDRADIVLSFRNDKLRLASNILLPDSLGNALVLVADVENLNQGLDHVRGELYAKGENVNLELLNSFFPMLQVGVRAGRSDFEIWGRFNSLSERSFNGRLAFRDLEYRSVENSQGNTGQEVIMLDTKFQVRGSQDSWHLALIDSDIRTAERTWAGQKYEIKCIRCSNGAWTLSAALDYVNLADLLATLRHFPAFSERLLKGLPDVQVHGELSHVQLLALWRDQQIAKYAYRASLQDVAVVAPVYEFEASPLSGEVVGNHLQGSFVFDSSAVRIRANRFAEHAFPEQEITGRLKWKLADHGVLAALENVSFGAEGLRANLQGLVQLAHGKTHVDLQAEIPQAQLAVLKHWLPYKIMNPKLASWLGEGVRGGLVNRARLLIHGELEHVPFGDRPGRFEIHADIEDGSLEYRKSWPELRSVAANLEIRNAKLNVQGEQGKILNSSIHGFTASIDDFKLPRLIIRGNSSGPAQDVLDFLQQSSLIPEDSQIPRHIAVKGDVGLDLNLAVTLTRKLKKERHVDGVIEFRDTDLTLNLASLPFTKVNGKLKFTRQGATGKGVRAELYGSAFDVEAAQLKNGRTLLRMGGEFDVDAWLSANHGQAAQYIGGKTPVSATVSVPPFGKHAADKSLEINVVSDLTGTSLALPEPFHKDADVPSELKILTRYEAGEIHPMFIDFKKRYFAQAMMDLDGKQVTALEIRAGDDQFDLPSQGVKISGNFDRLNITEWMSAFRSDSKEGALTLQAIDVQADEMAVFGLALEDARFSLEENAKFWTGSIRSPTVSGEFQYPLVADADSIATARFERFRFDWPEEEIAFSIDPRRLPAMEVHFGQFNLGDHPIDNVTLKTEPSAQGMVIDSLAGEGDSLQITASGAWDVDTDNAHSTALDIVLVTQDLHDSLTGLGFESEAKKGEGVISAELRWPGAPYQFSLASFAGSADLRLKDGEILSVEPGAGRLVGLLNISVISRRLALDFSDFFSEGYVFDKIRGNLNFKDGNLTTEDLRIKGPSADIEIDGRTGIVAKDYDQMITVTPHVSGGLPWLGIPMGPAGVGGIYILGKIAEKIGIHVDKAVDKVVEVTYHMTGSWEDPKIEPVSQKAAETEPSSQSPPSGSHGTEPAAGSP